MQPKLHLFYTALATYMLLGVALPFSIAQNNPLNLVRGVDQTESQNYNPEGLVYVIQGDNLMTRARYDEAIMAYDYAIVQNPNYAEAYLKRAMAKFRTGMEDQGRKDYLKAQMLNPYVTSLYEPTKMLGLMAFDPVHWLRTGETRDLLPYYLKSFGNRPISGKETLMQVLTMLEQDGPNQTIDWLEKLPGRDSSARLLDLQAYLLEERGQLEDALVLHEQSLEVDPDWPLAYLNLSRQKAAEGNYVEALGLADESLDLAPELYPARFHRARLYTVLGQYDKALIDYEILLNEQVEPEKVLINYAIALKLDGRPLEALEALNIAMDQRMGDKAEALKLRGNISMLLGQPFDAIEDYTEAIRERKNLAEAYFNRGLAYLLANARTNACTDLKESVERGYEEGREVLKYFCEF